MKNITYLLIIITLCYSCDNDEWLDIKPKGKVIPERVEDYRLLMDQTQSSRSKSERVFISTGGDLFLTDDEDLNAEVLSYYAESIINAYTFSEHTYLETEEDKDWQKSYNQIYVANFVIEEVLTSIGDEIEKKKVYAEAKVHRAYAYLNLVNLYGKHYNLQTSKTDLGVPIRLNSSLEGSLKRGTVQNVYDLILNDLEEIYKYLPEEREERWRPSQAAASALLARMYLLMGNFEKALQNAEKSLSKYNFLYDYNNLSKDSYGDGNLLLFPPVYENEEQILFKQPHNKSQFIYPSEELTSLYDTENDLRYAGMMHIDFFGFGLTYFREFLTGRPSGLSVPEMILIRAECNARLGNVDATINDLNLLREKRIKTDAYTPVSALNAVEALGLVKKERRLELAFLGYRWYDIKRYNEYDNANISINHIFDGKTYTLEPGDNRWVLPIARKYILKNPEIEQNPR